MCSLFTMTTSLLISFQVLAGQNFALSWSCYRCIFHSQGRFWGRYMWTYDLYFNLPQWSKKFFRSIFTLIFSLDVYWNVWWISFYHNSINPVNWLCIQMEPVLVNNLLVFLYKTMHAALRYNSWCFEYGIHKNTIHGQWSKQKAVIFTMKTISATCQELQGKVLQWR